MNAEEPLLYGKVESSPAGAVAFVARLDGTIWQSPPLPYAIWAREAAQREHALEGILWVSPAKWGNHVALRGTQGATAASSAAALAGARTPLLGAEILTAIAGRAQVEGGYLEGCDVRMIDGTDGRALRLDVRGALYTVTITPAVVPMRKAGE